nr:Os04g0165801 [Ipomoea batatas]
MVSAAETRSGFCTETRSDFRDRPSGDSVLFPANQSLSVSFQATRVQGILKMEKDDRKMKKFDQSSQNVSGSNSNSLKYLSVFAIPPMPLAGSVSTKSAPNTLIVTLRSMLVYDGIVKTILYPFMAEMNAILIPIFPDVGSIKVVYKFYPTGQRKSYETLVINKTSRAVSVTVAMGAVTFPGVIKPFFSASAIIAIAGLVAKQITASTHNTNIHKVG